VTLVNAQCRLAARPVGLPKATDWTFNEEPVPSPADGELLVRVEYLSIDPAMRTWMNAGRSYVPPVEIGEVMRAAGIARVIESRHADFAVGGEVFYYKNDLLVNGTALKAQQQVIAVMANGKYYFRVADWFHPFVGVGVGAGVGVGVGAGVGVGVGLGLGVAVAVGTTPASTILYRTPVSVAAYNSPAASSPANRSRRRLPNRSST